MLNFQVACAQKFQNKNNNFCAVSKYGMLLLICENLEKMICSKYRRANPKNLVFSILRCFKIHN